MEEDSEEEEPPDTRDWDVPSGPRHPDVYDPDLDIRITALTQAVNSVAHMNFMLDTGSVIQKAKRFEEYIREGS